MIGISVVVDHCSITSVSLPPNSTTENPTRLSDRERVTTAGPVIKERV